MIVNEVGDPSTVVVHFEKLAVRAAEESWSAGNPRAFNEADIELYRQQQRCRAVFLSDEPPPADTLPLHAMACQFFGTAVSGYTIVSMARQGVWRLAARSSMAVAMGRYQEVVESAVNEAARLHGGDRQAALRAIRAQGWIP